jgi:hypothetical protein
MEIQSDKNVNERYMYIDGSWCVFPSKIIIKKNTIEQSPSAFAIFFSDSLTFDLDSSIMNLVTFSSDDF